MKYILPHAAKCLKSSASISLQKLETNFHIYGDRIRVFNTVVLIYRHDMSPGLQ